MTKSENNTKTKKKKYHFEICGKELSEDEV